MSQYLTKNLQQQFPDLSQSTVHDVLEGCNNDANAARKTLSDMNDQEKREQEAKIREVSGMFDKLKIKDVKKVLEANKWNIETSLVDLFNLSEKKADRRGKKERQLAEQKRQEELKEQRRLQTLEQTENLKKLFIGIPHETVQRILDSHEGDTDETTTELLQIVAAQEEEKRKKADKERRDAEERNKREQEELNRLKIQALCDKQGATHAEAIESLNATEWDIKKALTHLIENQIPRKTLELQKAFPTFSVDTIREALLDNNWDVVKSAEALGKMKNKEEQRKQEESSWNQRMQQNILASSVLIGKKVDEDIKEAQHTIREDQKAEQDHMMTEFRKQIEDLIAAQARFGVVPGGAPPLIRQIDEIVGKKPAPVQEVQPELEAPKIEAPVRSEMGETKPFDSSFTVTLTVNPEKPDVGNPITVDWNITSGQVSTSYDWIGIFPVDKTNKQYLTYQWIGKDKKSGALTFNAPKNYGTYEFRFFSNNTYNHVQKSSKVVVGPQVDLKAELDDKTGKISVKWVKLSGNDCPSAWVGLYEKSQADNNKYITWEYAKQSDNTIVFDAPIKPTLYEARFFTNSYSDITRSNSISIQGEDSISASVENGLITIKLNIVTVDPAYSNAWIGLYFTNQTDNRQWRRYKYVADRCSNIQFKLPNTAGEYEARLFANRTYDLLLRSNNFVLPSK
eukprot:TRINITY_DN974_c0_g1_i1.p1 TRINITY_DN974_c0_g1~~TRINITY_DN974_c0_g1_i1.p1  ORF type:complete len:682 (-),score=268.06 TRINITY_DN974_c0_g1_i1:225-2270(-)